MRRRSTADDIFPSCPFTTIDNISTVIMSMLPDEDGQMMAREMEGALGIPKITIHHFLTDI